MKSKLDEIEARLQAWIESGIAWLPWRSRQPRLGTELVEALRAQITREAAGELPAANILHIFMPPAVAAVWLSRPDWQAWLLDVCKEMAREAGIAFFAEPELSLKPDPELGPRELRLITAFPSQEVGSTAVMPAASGSSPEKGAKQPVSAFLILHGKDIFPLTQAVINIGRRHDNHIVLNDLRVSRAHAQIRSVRGSYTLFDLNSTGGTFVNGKRISQHILLPGDVISFAGVTAIYGEESVAGKDGRGTSPAQVRPREVGDE